MHWNNIQQIVVLIDRYLEITTLYHVWTCCLPTKAKTKHTTEKEQFIWINAHNVMFVYALSGLHEGSKTFQSSTNKPLHKQFH